MRARVAFPDAHNPAILPRALPSRSTIRHSTHRSTDRRPAGHDRRPVRDQRRKRSPDFARRQMGRLRGQPERPGEGSQPERYLDDQLGRRDHASSSPTPRRKAKAIRLESRREIPGIPFRPGRRERRLTTLAAQHGRRRSGAGHREQERHRELCVGAGRQAPGLHHRRWRLGRGRRNRHHAQGALPSRSSSTGTTSRRTTPGTWAASGLTCTSSISRPDHHPAHLRRLTTNRCHPGRPTESRSPSSAKERKIATGTTTTTSTSWTPLPAPRRGS